MELTVQEKRVLHDELAGTVEYLFGAFGYRLPEVDEWVRYVRLNKMLDRLESEGQIMRLDMGGLYKEARNLWMTWKGTVGV